MTTMTASTAIDTAASVRRRRVQIRGALRPLSDKPIGPRPPRLRWPTPPPARDSSQPARDRDDEGGQIGGNVPPTTARRSGPQNRPGSAHAGQRAASGPRPGPPTKRAMTTTTQAMTPLRSSNETAEHHLGTNEHQGEGTGGCLTVTAFSDGPGSARPRRAARPERSEA